MQLCGPGHLKMSMDAIYVPPYQAKITYIPIVKFSVPLVSVQLELSTI